MPYFKQQYGMVWFKFLPYRRTPKRGLLRYRRVGGPLDLMPHNNAIRRSLTFTFQSCSSSVRDSIPSHLGNVLSWPTLMHKYFFRSSIPVSPAPFIQKFSVVYGYTGEDLSQNDCFIKQERGVMVWIGLFIRSQCASMQRQIVLGKRMILYRTVNT